ncbi:MAG: hypothetical protein WBA93_33635 [Microcoleaceae cyanobacterium]
MWGVWEVWGVWESLVCLPVVRLGVAVRPRVGDRGRNEAPPAG